MLFHKKVHKCMWFALFTLVLSSFQIMPLQAEELPDLIITKADRYSITNIDDYASLSFTVTIKNNSDVPITLSDPLYLSVSAPAHDNYPTGFILTYNTFVTNLAANEERTINLGSYVLPRYNKLNQVFSFSVDRDLHDVSNDNIVAESNELNNVFTKQICYSGPTDFPQRCLDPVSTTLNPVNVQVQCTSDYKPQITWQFPNNDNMDAYFIYRSEVRGQAGEEVDSDYFIGPEDAGITTSFIDTTAADGKEYYYKVKLLYS